MVEETRREMAEHAARTDQLIAQVRAEANEREKRIDERIEKLVSGIGELMRRFGNGKP